MNSDTRRLQATDRAARDERRDDIRAAMLGRADRRRRDRRLGRSALSAACAAAVAATAWTALRTPPSPAPARRSPALAADAGAVPLPGAHEPADADTATVVTRAITDDELVELLAEAGEEAGLAIINGEARLVRWHADPDDDPPTEQGPGAGPATQPSPDRARALAAS